MQYCCIKGQRFTTKGYQFNEHQWSCLCPNNNLSQPEDGKRTKELNGLHFWLKSLIIGCFNHWFIGFPNLKCLLPFKGFLGYKKEGTINLFKMYSFF